MKELVDMCWSLHLEGNPSFAENLSTLALLYKGQSWEFQKFLAETSLELCLYPQKGPEGALIEHGLQQGLLVHVMHLGFVHVGAHPIVSHLRSYSYV